MDAVSGSFKYRVLAGAVTSPTYAIGIAYPPMVTKIDLEYSYPEALGLKARAERGGGNVYAPKGATVRVHVYTDRPVALGHLKLGDGERFPLAVDKPTELSVVLRVEGDNSYHVILAGTDGVISTGDIEYLIRAVDDRSDHVRPKS